MSFALGILGVLLSLPAWLYFLNACGKLYRHISAGRPEQGRTEQPLRRGLRTAAEIFLHTRMRTQPWVALAHWFVMMGFLLGVIVWFEAYIQTFNPAGGWPLLSSWSVYHFLEEILAIGTTLGILFLIAVRLHKGTRERISRFYGSNKAAAYFVEAIVLIEALGMLAVKAGKIATYGHGSPWADFLTIHLAGWLPASPTLVSVLALIKLLTGMLWLVVVAHHLNWGVAWHRILAFFNIYFARPERLGGLTPLRDDTGVPITLETIDSLPEDTPLGLGSAQDASWKTLLDVTSCTECGRCQEQCPAWHTEKPLSPKLLVTSLRDAALQADLSVDNSHAGVDVLKLVGETAPITEDVLWSCTNCGACVEQCPVDIEHIDHVANLRRFQVLAESSFPTELGGMFKNLEVKGNPWGRNNNERSSWVDEARADGFEVPIAGEDIQDFSDTEYLFWVGCAGAFDDAGKRTTRAVVELLHTAGVKFAVLATGETCTGDPARRAGNEFLFQQLAMENIETLNTTFAGVPAGQRKIITTCPHCFNTIRNEYPDFDGHFDVFHHTQLLNRLVRDGLLTPVPRGPENRKPVTYHDPCFLGRHNKVFDPPRELIESATGGLLTEMPRNRNEGFCCGAGGARMFMEEKIGTRINEVRAEEAAATGAGEVVVGCPFCNTMMTGGLKALDNEDTPKVKDVAQMLRDAVADEQGILPAPRPKAFLDLPIRSVRKPHEEPPAPATQPKATEKPQAPASTPNTPASAPTPAPGNALPTPGTSSPAPAPGGAAPTPGCATVVPAPGAPAAPAPSPGAAVPAPGGSPVPTPGAIPAPGTTAPAVPAPGGQVPVPGAPSPAAPATPAPGGAVPTPGGSVPQAPIPGAAPAVAVPAPGTSTPPAPAVPVPGLATPPAPTATPNSAIPTPGTAVPSPGSAVPVPGADAPPAASPSTPNPSVPTPPGGAVPPPSTPVALGSAAPAPGGSVPLPGYAVPAPGQTPQGTVPAPGGNTPGVSAPAAPPGGVVPPGAALPKPGGVTPRVSADESHAETNEDQGKP